MLRPPSQSYGSSVPKTEVLEPSGPSHHSITDPRDRTSTQEISFHEESIRRLLSSHSGRGRQPCSRGAHVLTALPQHFLPSDLLARLCAHTRAPFTGVFCRHHIALIHPCPLGQSE